MAANRKILVLPGDGIGPEVMAQVQRVIDWFDNKGSVRFEVTEDLVGGACYDSHGVSIREETMEVAVSTDAVLFGAVGGPRWDDVPREHRPEAGLLRLRKDLDLFANLRPAIVLDAMVEASTLKSEVVKGLDIIILRELTSGVYFGEPRGEQIMEDGTKRVVDTQAYTEDEIVRILRVAFELARKRKNRVHCAEKSNVMETGVFWRKISARVAEEEYPDVEFHHILADNCAMQLLRDPHQFDVIVTDNLFGDILSDEAAMMTGSLGMLPSASLGNPDPITGKRYAMYEPVHGSAPDIAGEGKANPLAMLLSFSMMLRYSFDLPEEADRVETVVQKVLNEGFRTGDIMQDGCHLVSTEEMGSKLLLELDRSIQ
ncbi:MAG: 3-isopropylmalate dehydrogenase [Alphaproteobacteria bacterium]|jgi:3-isopropylmalate dehydrogenase|nr:3-isopropylmalate dehydrogenase [Alphaproteobacteria bacterium]PPR13853.1 MAG: 3-isopropylmalate dehydrogenase [Alphaproteobacteria bacterium MarineAlpha12_Bin1]|tara:strand:- start:1692 stop:2807 length:1116 start_codon:yes stop_codon:yes gene_type:complete